MKRIIFSTLAFVLAVLGTVSFAHAQSFNNDPRDMATVLVGKTGCSAGPVDGCWQSSVTASPGDTVAVHLYYHNTGTTTANNVAVGINPRTTGVASSHTMRGGILVNGTVVKTGSAVISLTSPASLTFIDATWFPNQTTSGQSANATALFDNYGMSVGNLAPGWGAQGTVVARYRVGDSAQTTYQCNDGYDNDGDGRVDYPNDPGCSSATDNYEGDDQQSQCYVNQYYASPTTVTSGGFTMLYWTTSGCDYLTIDGVNYPVNSSGAFGPLYSGRNYELRAWKNNGTTQTRTVYVGVNQINNNTYQCNDGYDNDGDGRVDYPNDPGCSSAYDNDEYNTVITQTQPQAVTTVATINSTTTARLNGIAVPNYSGTSQAWFEWGPSGSLGYRTNVQTVTNTGSTYISDIVSGLVPGTMYYYRTVVQNGNGTAYGDIVRFQTQQGTVTPPRVITKVVTQTVKDVVVAKSAPSLLELRVENVYDRMCVGGEMEYTIYYRNISSQTLKDTVLRVVHPKELTFVNASRGDYEVVDRALTLPLGELTAGESGSVVVRVRVNNEAVRGNVAVLTAQVVYTNTVTKAQEDAIAYSLITVSDDCPNVLGASAFGIGSFFPTTLLGWLVLILIILALIVLGRQLYKKKA